MKSIGIIGYGGFGKFLAEKLDLHANVRVYSYSGKSNQWSADLKIVAESDYLIPAIPLDAYERTLNEVKSLLRPDTVIVDVCSVKEQPMAIIKSIVPTQPAVATHPLFGPESAKHTLTGHSLVLCPEASDASALKDIEKFGLEQGLNVVQMTCVEHDKEMAVVQGLTFFIAHALKELNLDDQQLTTPSFQRLLQLANLEAHHSNDLFQTIQSGNTHTATIRKQFIELCKTLDASITNK